LSLAFLPPVQERILDAFQNQHQSLTQGMNSFAWRLTLWSDSIPLIMDRPLFGYGLTMFKQSSPLFSKWAQIGGSGAHNVYIELLFETGIIGLVAYLAIYFILIKQVLFYYKHLQGDRQKGVAAMVLVYVIGYLIVCAIDNLQQVLVANWYVWFFIGAMYRYFQICLEQQNSNMVKSQ
jgi:O-antigen ligase